MSIATKIKLPQAARQAYPSGEANPATPLRSGWKISRHYTIPALMGGSALGLRCLGHNGKSWRQVAWMIPAAIATIGATKALVGSIMYKLEKRDEKQRLDALKRDDPNNEAYNANPIDQRSKEAGQNAALQSAINSAQVMSARIIKGIFWGSLLEKGWKTLRNA